MPSPRSTLAPRPEHVAAAEADDRARALGTDAEDEAQKIRAAAAHTPGPWHDDAIDRIPGGITADRYITGPDGRHIGATTSTQQTTVEERAANAKLIAAAPDLLAAVRAYIDQLEERVVALGWHSADQYAASCKDGEPYLLAKAAIAKAEGRA